MANVVVIAHRGNRIWKLLIQIQ